MNSCADRGVSSALTANASPWYTQHSFALFRAGRCRRFAPATIGADTSVFLSIFAKTLGSSKIMENQQTPTNNHQTLIVKSRGIANERIENERIANERIANERIENEC